MIKTIDTSVEDITENEVWHMASAVLWKLGIKRFSETDTDMDAVSPTMITCVYVNFPKESLYIKGNYFIDNVLEKKKINPLKMNAKQLTDIFNEDMVYFDSLYVYKKPLRNEHLEINYWNGKEIGFPQVSSILNNGPWLEDLKEIYNRLVDSYPIIDSLKD